MNMRVFKFILILCVVVIFSGCKTYDSVSSDANSKTDNYKQEKMIYKGKCKELYTYNTSPIISTIFKGIVYKFIKEKDGKALELKFDKLKYFEDNLEDNLDKLEEDKVYTVKYDDDDNLISVIVDDEE